METILFFWREEKGIIEAAEVEQGSSFNSALRHIVIEYRKERNKRVH
jgi:hypothetical protein